MFFFARHSFSLFSLSYILFLIRIALFSIFIWHIIVIIIVLVATSMFALSLRLMMPTWFMPSWWVHFLNEIFTMWFWSFLSCIYDLFFHLLIVITLFLNWIFRPIFFFRFLKINKLSITKAELRNDVNPLNFGFGRKKSQLSSIHVSSLDHHIQSVDKLELYSLAIRVLKFGELKRF